MPATKGSDGAIPVREYLAQFDPHVRALIVEVRRVAKDVAPGAEEKAFRGWALQVSSDRGSIGIGGFRDHVNVNIRVGASLRDPHGLLHGTGSTYRHATVRSVPEARDPRLRDLIRQQLASGPRRLVLRAGKGMRILERVRRVCLALPDVSERLSHGTPTFFARGKQFAQVWAGHHDDHGLQLWCAAPSGAQAALVKADPDRFFVPPYVGVRGWLGVRLDRDLGRSELDGIVKDAYAEVAAGKRRG
jgi:hypothetical protein